MTQVFKTSCGKIFDTEEDAIAFENRGYVWVVKSTISAHSILFSNEEAADRFMVSDRKYRKYRQTVYSGFEDISPKEPVTICGHTMEPIEEYLVNPKVEQKDDHWFTKLLTKSYTLRMGD